MPLRIYKRPGSDYWHYRGTVDGRRLRGSCQTKDKATAERVAHRLEGKAWKRSLDGPGAVLTFAKAASLYRSAGKATRYLTKIENHWKNALVSSMTPGAIRQSALTLYPHAAGATRNRQVIVPTQAIINHAAEAELCPRIRVKRFPVIKKEKTPATWIWVEAFSSASSPTHGALAKFMFLTGARISEALSVEWSDVDLSLSRVLIRQTKIGAERYSHLPAPLVAALANIPGKREGKVFRYRSRKTLKPSWDKAAIKAGIQRLTPHSCRHGFATAMLRAGVDPVTVAKLGGWKSPAHLFATYGHALDDLTLTDRIAGVHVLTRSPIDALKMTIGSI